MEFISITRKVKNARLEIKNGILYVIVPKGVSAEDVVKRNKKWIDKKIQKIKIAQEKIRKIEKQPRDIFEYKRVIYELVNLYKYELNVNISEIIFRKMKSRWGSCTNKGKLTFNTRAKDLPDIFLQYLVYHEVAHRVELNHSSKFWKIIVKKFPNYKEISFLLKNYRLNELI